MNKELPYWLALAHTPKVKTKTKNEITASGLEKGKSIIDFFHSGPSSWGGEYGLSQSEVGLFKTAYDELPNYAFLAEDLLEQGYGILPINSKDYPPALKENLGRTYAPPVIYTKGNLQILKEKSIALVGSRKASDVSLRFTDNIAQNAVKAHKAVVSGFAKGVDKQALESALKHNGRSIIVLPQGIATFRSGFKKYYKEIINGDVLVLSTFYPKAAWSAPLAMARNHIIYGLAPEIYVAESGDKGGTWAGAVNGLKKGQAIYVRSPKAGEKNANKALISKGAKAVDQKGNVLSHEAPSGPNGTEDKIIGLLKQATFDSKSIVEKLKIDWPARKVTSFLKTRPDIETHKGKPMKFTHKSRVPDGQTKLFT